MNELTVLLNGKEAGIVANERGKLTFRYADSWRSSASGYPLSLSMPLAGKTHSHTAIEAFIWGLLPDNDQVLARWGKKFGVSPRNAFNLIAHVGEDCAGAVQFVRTENVAAVMEAVMPEPDWLTEAEVALRLRIVKADASAGRLPGDRGQFSLAGAQPKTSLLYYNGRWGMTSGRTPTTHILKPASTELEGHAENEHLCLRLAAALGIPTTQSDVKYFEEVPTIVVQRYDRLMIAEAATARKATSDRLFAEAAILRVRADSISVTEASALEFEATEDLSLANDLARLAETEFVGRTHQEDFCQVLSIPPVLKYQNDGGPGPKEIVEIIRQYATSHERAKVSPKFPNTASSDLETFMDALIFNWLIGGTDAHAKNYSLLIGGGGMVRLAPLYDIASIFAYPDIDHLKARLAMKIGDEYRLRYIGLSDWRKLAANVRVDEDALIDRLRAMAAELPDRLADEIKIMRDCGLKHGVIDTLAELLPERAAKISTL